jgi:hypothetical protein
VYVNKMVEKDMNAVKWLMCLLALAAVVLTVLILVKINKKCGGTQGGSGKGGGNSSSSGRPTKRLRLKVHSNNKPLSRGAGIKVNANNSVVVDQLAQDYCGNIDPKVTAKFMKIMGTEIACESTIWGDNDDDMVMVFLCNAPIDIEFPDGTVTTMNFHDYLKTYNPEGYKTVLADIECASNPPEGKPVNCCGGNPNPVWNN